MDESHSELEEIKAAMEKLTADFLAKSELSDGLRRAYDEQCAKLQEAEMRFEKQARELSAKSDEISSARQLYEDLKLSLHEKDSVLKHLSSTSEQLRARLGEKLTALEGENRDLSNALNEANAKTEEQAHKISIYEGEVGKLKCLLSESQRKCFDAEKKAEAAKELKMREEVFLELEQENGKILEQLKWKAEQFRHLEDAKGKLQDQFLVAKKEWLLEKSNLVDEICSLQKNLESKTRVAEDLNSRLQMCNQALAHEQSRRNMLEIQISESQATYENVATEYEVARHRIDKLTAKRDDEIATLRNLLVTKDTLLKESEHRKADLEQENQELHAALKELQESQINEAGAAASLRNVRQKLKSLEHAHNECPTILKAKEAEWHSKTEKLEKDLSDCLSTLSCNDDQFHEFQLEMEATLSSLVQSKLENDELSVILAVFLSKYSEVQSELERMQDEVEHSLAEKVDQISLLKEQIKNKSSALDQAMAEIDGEHGAKKTLLERVEALELIEQKYLFIQKELKVYKEMLEESSSHVNHLKALAVQKEFSFREELSSMLDPLDAANCALIEEQRELCLVKFELQQCKSAAERLEKSKENAEGEMKTYRDECQSIRKELESSLLARMEMEKAIEHERGHLFRIMEEKDRKLDDFRQQISQLEADLATQESVTMIQAKLEPESTLKSEKENFLQITGDKDKRLECMQKEYDLLMQEFSRAESEAVITIEQERINFIQLTKEKEEELANLREQIMSLEEEFTRSLETAITLELADKQLEVDTLYEGFEKIIEAYVLDALELEYKKLLFAALEEEFESLEQKLETQEKVSFDLKTYVIDLQSKLEIERSERERDQIQIEEELENMRFNEKSLNDEAKEFKRNIKKLHEAVRQLSSERQEVALQMTEFYDVLTEIMCKDDELMIRWNRLAHNAECCKEFKGETLNSNRTEGKNSISVRNKTRAIPESREPLKEYNS